MTTLLTRREAAKFLGVSVAAFDQHVRGGGQLPEIKIGRLPRFRLEDLEAWVADQAEAATAPLGAVRPVARPAPAVNAPVVRRSPEVEAKVRALRDWLVSPRRSRTPQRDG